jgi:hypothetical protein
MEGEVWSWRERASGEYLIGVGNLNQPSCGNFHKGDTTMTNEQRKMTAEEVEKWLAIRKEAGLHIDPETADVEWTYAYTLDPYGVENVPEEYQCIGREYFARSPGSDVWVNFGDLPEATERALWEKHKRKLAFPAGLEGLC